MIKELEFLDKKLYKKFLYVLKETKCTKQEALEYLVNDDPVLWAKVYLNWQARDYQLTILRTAKKSLKLVLRLGRRLGKTECMCVLILWFAFTQYNKGQNNQYNILIITPYETQIDLIFKRLHQLIDLSQLISSLITRDVYHAFEFSNSTIITGLTAGSKSGSGAANTRGQRADVIFLDEIDYMTSSDITNIINIRNEAPSRIKIIASSTPSGKHEEFYKWCTFASKKYRPIEDDIKNYTFTKYELIEEKGNGWVEVYAPSIVNKELLKINSDTNQTYLQDLKDELSEMRFVQEVMADFGEQEMGVYQHRFIEAAVEEGKRVNHKYLNLKNYKELKKYVDDHRNSIRMLGVDWDRSTKAGTNIVCVELDKLFVNREGAVEPKFKVLFRIEIPKSEFTFTDAVNKIIELNDIFKFDHIAIDRGYGDTQLEMLRKYGIANPITGLAEKTVGYQFSEKIEVRDPYTRKVDRKPLKPFMVNNSVNVFEKEKIIFDPSDKQIVEQFVGYKIKSISSSGLPIYSDENEHIIDAVNLCLLIFEQNYGALLKRIISTQIYSIDTFKGKEDEAIKDRDIQIVEKQENDTIKDYAIIHSTRSKTKVVQIIPTGNHIRRSPNFSRR